MNVTHNPLESLRFRLRGATTVSWCRLIKLHRLISREPYGIDRLDARGIIVLRNHLRRRKYAFRPTRAFRFQSNKYFLADLSGVKTQWVNVSGMRKKKPLPLLCIRLFTCRMSRVSYIKNNITDFRNGICLLTHSFNILFYCHSENITHLILFSQ